MAYRIEPDILVVDEFNRPVAVVETKIKYHLAEEWAQSLARRYASTVGAPYALVITPEWLYVWRAGNAIEDEREWIASAASVLLPLFSELGFDPHSVSINGFEGLVALWLDDVIALVRHGEGLPKNLAIFEESGLAEELPSASIERGVRFETVR